jgi:hypothetical protein
VGTGSHAETAHVNARLNRAAPLELSLPLDLSWGTFKDHACLVSPPGCRAGTPVSPSSSCGAGSLAPAAQLRPGRLTAAGAFGSPVASRCQGMSSVAPLGYLGWAIDAYAALSRWRQPARGPDGAQLSARGTGRRRRGCSGSRAPGFQPANFLPGKLGGEESAVGRYRESQWNARRLSQAAGREVFLRIGASQRPVHLVTAIAGAGKSTLVQASARRVHKEDGEGLDPVAELPAGNFPG